MKSQEKVELVPVYADSDTATVLAKLKEVLTAQGFKITKEPKRTE